MEKDKRYGIVKNLIEGGYIKSFGEIFNIIPKTVVAKDLGMNNTRFSTLIAKVDKFLLKGLFLIASFINVSEDVLLNLILQEYLSNKKVKKKKA